MIIAAILILAGITIGLFYGYGAVLLASALTTVGFFTLWIWLGEFGWFTILVWIGYLFALQSGFLLGSYLASGDRADEEG